MYENNKQMNKRKAKTHRYKQRYRQLHQTLVYSSLRLSLIENHHNCPRICLNASVIFSFYQQCQAEADEEQWKQLHKRSRVTVK